MPEWWSYSLSDFLLFSPRTYYRLIERYNLAVWPGQIVTLAFGMLIPTLLWKNGARHSRATCGILAFLWAWLAWAFLWKRYATINWAVAYILPLFALQVVLLVWIGIVRHKLAFRLSSGITGMSGISLLLLSTMLYPALAPLLGRGWRQAEVFGIAPDPTVIGTAGLLLLADGRTRWELLAVPLVWCLLSALTLWAMGSAEALVVGVAGIAVIAAGGLNSR